MDTINIEVANNGYIVRAGFSDLTICKDKEELHNHIDEILTNNSSN